MIIFLVTRSRSYSFDCGDKEAFATRDDAEEYVKAYKRADELAEKLFDYTTEVLHVNDSKKRAEAKRQAQAKRESDV